MICIEILSIQIYFIKWYFDHSLIIYTIIIIHHLIYLNLARNIYLLLFNDYIPIFHNLDYN